MREVNLKEAKEKIDVQISGICLNKNEIDRWMAGGWMEHMDRWIDGQTDRHTQIHRWIDTQIHR